MHNLIRAILKLQSRRRRPLPDRTALLGRLAIRAGIALASASLFAGCASRPIAGDGAHLYDLGPLLPRAGAPAPLAPLKVLALSAPRNLESTAFIYRLQYADARRVASYANSRWTMPPSQLLTQRLRSALSAHGTVLAATDLESAPLLRVELTDFEQVFDGPGSSRGVVSMRATLSDHSHLLGQRVFVATPAAPGADAAGGAKALAEASDQVIAQLIAWLGSMAPPSTFIGPGPTQP